MTADYLPTVSQEYPTFNQSCGQLHPYIGEIREVGADFTYYRIYIGDYAVSLPIYKSVMLQLQL